MIRALVSLVACFLALAKDGAFLMDQKVDEQTVRRCVLDGVEATSELLDSGVYLWAATQRCGKVGEKLKCEVDVASAAEAANGAINVVLKAMHQCNVEHTDTPKCGLAIGRATQSAMGLAAVSGGIAQRCPHSLRPPKSSNSTVSALQFQDLPNDKWQYGRGSTCLLDLTDTMNSLLKAARRIMAVTRDHEESEQRYVSNVMKIVSAVAGVGEYLLAATGQCQSGWGATADLNCGSEIAGLIRQLDGIAIAGKEMSEHCLPASEFKKDFGIIWHPENSSRLYDADYEVRSPPAGSFATRVLAALLPVTAVVGFFVGSRSRLHREAEREAENTELVEESLLDQ